MGHPVAEARFRLCPPLDVLQLPSPKLGFLIATVRGGFNPCEFSAPFNGMPKWMTARVQIVLVPYWFLLTCFAMPASIYAIRKLAGHVRASHSIGSTGAAVVATISALRLTDARNAEE